jgi:hypothetical protein
MARTVTAWERFKERLYPFVILIAIGVAFYSLVYKIHIEPKETNVWRTIYLVIQITLIVMTLWCFIKTYFTDPGAPPLFWGFYLDEVDERRRRYCLICHTFKPERCHHCSTCNKCILNMDHHCPWLNNCVGFNNRKYFMMLLMYAWLVVLCFIIGGIPHLIDLFIRLKETGVGVVYSHSD